MKELAEITGMPINTPDDVQSLYSTLKAEVCTYFLIEFAFYFIKH